MKARKPALVEAVAQHAEELKGLSSISFAPPPLRSITDRFHSTPSPRSSPESARLSEHEVRSRRAELYKEQRCYETALETARTDLRQALGDDEITALLLTSFGHEVRISNRLWRTNNGLKALFHGVLLLEPPNSFPAMSGTVLLIEDEFLRWSTPSKPAVSIAKRTLCIDWLTKMMRAAPNTPRRKADVAGEAYEKFEVSGRSFSHAWGVAVHDAPAPDWSRAGAKPKR